MPVVEAFRQLAQRQLVGAKKPAAKFGGLVSLRGLLVLAFRLGLLRLLSLVIGLSLVNVYGQLASLDQFTKSRPLTLF